MTIHQLHLAVIRPAEGPPQVALWDDEIREGGHLPRRAATIPLTEYLEPSKMLLLALEAWIISQVEPF